MESNSPKSLRLHKRVELRREASSSPERKKKYATPRVMWREKLRLLKATPPALLLEKKILRRDVSKESPMFLLFKNEDDSGALMEFLTEKERAKLDEGVDLLLLDRKGDEYPQSRIFRRGAGGESVVAGEWTEFVGNNQLHEGDMVEVFLFRVPQGEGEGRLGAAVCSSTPADEIVRRARGPSPLSKISWSPARSKGEESECKD